MKLLTKQLRMVLPPLYSQENTEDPKVHAKFFTPDSNWTWFLTVIAGAKIDHMAAVLGCWWRSKTSVARLLRLQATAVALEAASVVTAAPLVQHKFHFQARSPLMRKETSIPQRVAGSGK